MPHMPCLVACCPVVLLPETVAAQRSPAAIQQRPDWHAAHAHLIGRVAIRASQAPSFLALAMPDCLVKQPPPPPLPWYSEDLSPHAARVVAPRTSCKGCAAALSCFLEVQRDRLLTLGTARLVPHDWCHTLVPHDWYHTLGTAILVHAAVCYRWHGLTSQCSSQVAIIINLFGCTVLCWSQDTRPLYHASQDTSRLQHSYNYPPRTCTMAACRHHAQ